MYAVEIADSLPGPKWLKERRGLAARRASLQTLPSFEAEEWRYSPIDSFDPATFAPAAIEPTGEHLEPFQLPNAVASLHTVDGFVVGGLAVSAAGLTVSSARSMETVDLRAATDVFGESNAAFSPDPIVVTVAPGQDVDGAIVITHDLATPGVAAFPSVHVNVGSDASVTVVEVFRSADISALTIPATSITVGSAARVKYQQVQNLGAQTWQLGSLWAEVGSQAHFVGGVAAMGGAYGRLRTDCRLRGRGATGDLLAAYFGSGDQTLDFRTFQDHLARDTSSNLLFKGVLDGASTSIYTGLIRVAENAAGTNAFQTNRNIKLSEQAWAESVPNLEIENNDVHCSHASTVSPVDPEQRFYLESRGVPTPVAERLIVEGFLAEVVNKLPVPELAAHVSALIQAKLDARKQNEGAVL